MLFGLSFAFGEVTENERIIIYRTCEGVGEPNTYTVTECNISNYITFYTRRLA